ncbi:MULTISPECIES: 4Fe-4S binding protein [Desulfitobacterium]|uniref:4Fe-4S ferredoxin-type domain-containing protein n=1 Tax=Desulfitobacterium dehalogenans (strain ATCC 51507 / DSM 9161 / JW/IU-DC1) TaxID=756499 RepID=I4A8V5_DESDJ|nr:MULTISPECIES: 4Fe-4S binding protein [Desulfitobacterium]AFM00390.1 hypothetical protein Desde_2003 [Desulfitobacterium dehalogenans ATCC 51507]
MSMIFSKGAYIDIEEKRCLNLRHQEVECSHCLGHCPAEAIVYSEGHIYLDKDRCSGCGLCFSDCPTEVFRSKQWDESTIIRDIEDEGWKVTEFFCGRHTAPYKMDKAKDRGAVQLPACLSAVSKGAWYEAGLKTEIEIHLDQCKDCPLAKTIPRLEYNAGITAEWLEASGESPAFSYIRLSGQGKTKKSLLAIETGLKVTSRRDLFVSLINKGQRLAGKGTGGTNTFPEEHDKNMRNSCLPGWQRRLGEVLQQNSSNKDSAHPAYWPTIKINEQCVNCGMCSRFCPSGTLQITVKEGECNHLFTSGFCLDCRICQLFCPRGAISRDREKVKRPFEVLSIANNSNTTCQICGSATAHRGKNLCYWCEQEAASDQELKSSFRKMFSITNN